MSKISFYFVQKQTNGADCGVYAIANAMAIVNGQDPEDQNYIISKMCRHLHDCLIQKVMRHFPAKRRQSKKKCNIQEVEVFCKCRLQEGGDMAECEICKEWYHSTCEKIPKAVWTHTSAWVCSSCKK